MLQTESDADTTLDTVTSGSKGLEMMRIMTDSHLIYKNRDFDRFYTCHNILYINCNDS